MKRCSSLHTTSGALSSRPDVRRRVSCNIDSSPASGRNCLGCVSRETGQSRLPTPPERRTGVNIGFLYHRQGHGEKMMMKVRKSGPGHVMRCMLADANMLGYRVPGRVSQGVIRVKGWPLHCRNALDLWPSAFKMVWFREAPLRFRHTAVVSAKNSGAVFKTLLDNL